MAFNRKITIQRYEEVTDALMNVSDDWVDLYHLWAEVNGLYGAEYWAASSQGQENTIVFTVRWFSALDNLIFDAELTKYRVVYRGRYFDIRSFDNVEQKNILVKIKAVARG